jgi:hypothetical protein
LPTPIRYISKSKVQRSSHAVKKTGADLFIWITDRFLADCCLCDEQQSAKTVIRACRPTTKRVSALCATSIYPLYD